MATQVKNFIKFRPSLPLSDLLEIQKSSYRQFLEKDLAKLFKEMMTIDDLMGKRYQLKFVDYEVENEKFDEETCKKRNLTYEAPLRVTLAIVDKETGRKKEQNIYLGEIPLMTKRGTFIVNGIERVVVSQLIRSSGVFFSTATVKKTNEKLYGAKVIPDRGVWIEFELEPDQTMWVRIDRGRKIIASAFLRLFGLETDDQIYNAFKKYNQSDSICLKNTFEKEIGHSEEEAVKEIYRKLRPGEMATIDNARSLIHAMFFKENRYSLGEVGRYKFNLRLNLGDKINSQFLRAEDLVAILAEIMRMSDNDEEGDDVDHLLNRRIKNVGELVTERMRVGLMRLQRIIRDRMTTLKEAEILPSQLITTRPIAGVLREFFLTGQFSQFMDQVNPLADLEHKRKFTLTGPGGLTRERAAMEVRDVHQTFYGRICPISTPEGPNAGLVGFFACYSRLNSFGFIETPYFKVKNGKITKEIVYLNAKDEEQYIIAPFSTPCDQDGKILNEDTDARIQGEPGLAKASEVDFIDVGANQIISASTSLIPFLENDDTTRAMMGTNMQRQAVPLIRSEKPLVGTGMEGIVARNSGYMILADGDGKVEEADGNHIILRMNNGRKVEYQLMKFSRSNQDTCFNQHPIVDKGDKVKTGQALTNGPSIDGDELALGRNLLVAFMPWGGYNYNDAIILSQRVVKEDILSSIFIKEHIIDVQETRFGVEATTRDIPNVSTEKLAHLDEDGIIVMGSEVKTGDILVGKITPKGEVELSAEEKLLQAIFGEKARDVNDNSLYLKHGEHGKVIGVKIFSRDEGDRLPVGVIKSIHVWVADLRKIQVGDKIAGRHGNKGVVARILSEEDMPHLASGEPVDILLNPLGIINRMNLGQVLETNLGLAAKHLNYRAIVPALNGPSEKVVQEELKKAGFPAHGKVKLFDGRTGLPFEQETTVGYMHIIKLHHMVEDKIHQRSIGPYSLVTQQPLGGRAQFGGQRFGEMEVWALEGYGAAYNLQEMLTIKSDDVEGRTRAYEAITRDEPIEKMSIPESFNVLRREMQGLCLKIGMFKKNKKID